MHEVCLLISIHFSRLLIRECAEKLTVRSNSQNLSIKMFSVYWFYQSLSATKLKTHYKNSFIKIKNRIFLAVVKTPVARNSHHCQFSVHEARKRDTNVSLSNTYIFLKEPIFLPYCAC